VRRAVLGGLAVAGSIALAAPAMAAPAAHHPNPKPTGHNTPKATATPKSTPSSSPPPPPAPPCAVQMGFSASQMTAEPWPQARLDYEAVWPVTQGAGVTVAVIDSGVNASSPQLANRIAKSMVVPGTGGGDRDCVGHGTGVASIIGARDIGSASLFHGVAPQATLISIKYTNAPADATGTADMSTAIVKAVEAGAKVINISSQTGPSAQLKAAVEYAKANDAVIVASSGNLNQSDAQSPTPNYPANYPGVLSVGAVGPDGKLAGYSNGSSTVSVVAPGVKVTSVWAGGGYNYDNEGTSFSAPFVSGTVALVRAAHPGLSFAQVEHRIEVTADGGTSVGSGYGMINPVRAVTAVLPEENAGVAQPSPRPQPISLMRRHDGSSPGARFAAWFVPGALAAAVLAVALAIVVPAGRRRGWRPGSRQPTE
jgi:membrane-anchored mycosin MYCP